MSSIRATKRCAAAAAGVGMVLASFAGAAASATASTHHTTHHVKPNLGTTTVGVSTTAAAPIGIPFASLTSSSSTSGILPTITISDPAGAITATTVVTLTLGGAGVTTATTGATSFDAALGGSPTAIGGGAGTVVSSTTVAPVAGTATGGNGGTPTAPQPAKFQFTVGTPTTAGAAATYTISGLRIAGISGVRPGAVTLAVSGTGITTTTLHVAAVTNLLSPAYGAAAPDTAATLFKDAIPTSTTNLVVASDYEPQDAESANYLASRLTTKTGILLTDPSTLSSAVSGIFATYNVITTIYIVGGTSVVSTADQSALQAADPTATIIRLAGATQYLTNQAIINYVGTVTTGGATGFTAPAATTQLDFTQTKYNTSGGASSPTTLGTPAAAKTAIVVSGEISSYQDGIGAAGLSYKLGLPVILTQPGGLDDGARNLIISGGYKNVILLGGPLAVSNAVEADLTGTVASGGAGATVFRVAGADASDTAQLLASLETAPATNGSTALGFAAVDAGGGTPGGVLIARGNGFQDALAAGPYSGSTVGNTPILLTENATTLGTPLTSYLKTLGAIPTFNFTTQAIGGPLSVTSDVQAAAVAAEISGLPTP